MRLDPGLHPVSKPGSLLENLPRFCSAGDPGSFVAQLVPLPSASLEVPRRLGDFSADRQLQSHKGRLMCGGSSDPITGARDGHLADE